MEQIPEERNSSEAPANMAVGPILFRFLSYSKLLFLYLTGEFMTFNILVIADW